MVSKRMKNKLRKLVEEAPKMKPICSKCGRELVIDYTEGNPQDDGYLILYKCPSCPDTGLLSHRPNRSYNKSDWA
jgi:DNA-directed RNA polymerase subunit RPC12/RpoP